MKNKKLINITILIVILFIGTLLRLPYIDEDLLSYDEAGWYLAGNVIREGGIVYEDIWIHRMPGIFFIYSLFPKMFYLRLFTIFWNSLTILVIYFIAKEVFNRKAGYFAALLFAVFSATYDAWAFIASNCIIFMILPSALSIFFLIKSRKSFIYLIPVGFFSCLAIMIKLPALFELSGIIVYLFLIKLIDKDSILNLIKKYLLILLGFIISLIPFLSYFFYKGIKFKFITTPLLNNIIYSGTIPIFISVLRFFRTTLKLFLGANFLFWSLFLISFFFIAIPLLKNIIRKRKINKTYLLIIIWLFFCFIGVAAGRRFFAHYYLQMFPAISVISSFLILKIIEKIKNNFEVTNIFIILILIIGFIAPIFQYPVLYLDSRFTFKNLFSKEPTINEQIADYIKKNSKENDTILVWGGDIEIYYFSKRKPATRFIILESVTGFSVGSGKREISEEHRILFMKDLKKNMPVYIIDSSLQPGNIWSEFTIDTFDELNSFVKENYKLEAKSDKIKIYRRI